MFLTLVIVPQCLQVPAAQMEPEVYQVHQACMGRKVTEVLQALHHQ